MSPPLHQRTAREIAAAVRAGAVSATDVARHFLGRVASHDAALRAFLAVDPALTLDRAARVDEAVAAGRDPGPLAGVPFAVKDNLCLRGLPATCGSRMLEGWRPPCDADAVTRLLAAGAVPLGKTNLDEFAMGSSTENSAFGPARNPWDAARVPGGSSGGSAAAVAAGLAPLALGSDTGGSIRQPAAFCGVVGAMGSYGRVSRRGLVAFASSLDRVGPIARSVGDTALALSVLSGGDPGDATSLRESPPDWTAAAGGGVAGLRVGVLRQDETGARGEGIDAEVEALCNAAAARLAAAGATLVDVSLPVSAAHGVAVYHLVAASEASSNLARFDGVRYGLRAEGRDAASMTAASRGRGFGAEVAPRFLLGTFALSAGYADAFHERAMRVRRLIADEHAAAFHRCDVLVSPTSPTSAFPLGERTDDPLAMYLCDVLTVPASLAGVPALSVPAGLTAAGLPVGLQVVAPLLREDRMFRVAGAVEAALGPAPLAEAFR